ncbi:MAG: hypothetical protein ACI81T_001832 [Bacteroidia bacterium]|jgi:hypothetical protein
MQMEKKKSSIISKLNKKIKQALFPNKGFSATISIRN